MALRYLFGLSSTALLVVGLCTCQPPDPGLGPESIANYLSRYALPGGR